MIVISDTTPIISLMKAGRLDLLRELYGKVLIPKAVYRELAENIAFAKEAEIIKEIDYLTEAEVENKKISKHFA